MAENTLARVGLCAGLSHMETDVLDGNTTCLQRTEGMFSQRIGRRDSTNRQVLTTPNT